MVHLLGPLASLALLAASACGPYIDPAGAFATDVHPILTTRCAPCHSGDPAVSEAGPGSFAVPDPGASYTAVLAYVTPGDADGSPLITRLTSAPFMPPAPADPLDDATALRAWIDDGAQP